MLTHNGRKIKLKKQSLCLDVKIKRLHIINVCNS